MFGEFSFCAFGTRELHGVNAQGGEYIRDAVVR